MLGGQHLPDLRTCVLWGTFEAIHKETPFLKYTIHTMSFLYGTHKNFREFILKIGMKLDFFFPK